MSCKKSAGVDPVDRRGAPAPSARRGWGGPRASGASPWRSAFNAVYWGLFVFGFVALSAGWSPVIGYISLGLFVLMTMLARAGDL